MSGNNLQIYRYAKDIQTESRMTFAETRVARWGLSYHNAISFSWLLVLLYILLTFEFPLLSIGTPSAFFRACTTSNPVVVVSQGHDAHAGLSKIRLMMKGKDEVLPRSVAAIITYDVQGSEGRLTIGFCKALFTFLEVVEFVELSLA
ncbi:hypothetical protein K503DRAFT_774111 [Rhizopogon vinicolor AM-OR11-026]|uniref:Uncharacterized protein n=1 Tax=Rhizopogon vinicolor AM-OR11-026 TaxID=1314800 RepID=A0A1B7MQD9_9AGAM|nr:hypothetical protein K503DRAFT_774111 [Rhizopogon vinicolor AM-OR11-026]